MGMRRYRFFRRAHRVLAPGLGVLGVVAAALAQTAPHGEAPGAADLSAACRRDAAPGCLHRLTLPSGAGALAYYASASPGGATAAPTEALVVVHGYSRNVRASFRAGLEAAERAQRADRTLVVAPAFQVVPAQAQRCRSRGTPDVAPGDALWTCGGWAEGGLSRGGGALIGAFAALDALVAELHRQWPSLRTITLAGFSAGAQLVQRSVGFAADAPPGVHLRYVVAAPSSWLYFDAVRPVPQRGGQAADWATCGAGSAFPGDCTFRFAPPAVPAACPEADRWKYGLQGLPAHLGRTAAEARARYRAADVRYLEGADDSAATRGAAPEVLDQRCAAELQGPFRLQRGVTYAAYERAVVQPPQPRPLAVVPGCGHSVGCVLPSDAARAAVFGDAPAPAAVR